MPFRPLQEKSLPNLRPERLARLHWVIDSHISRRVPRPPIGADGAHV